MFGFGQDPYISPSGTNHHTELDYGFYLLWDGRVYVIDNGSFVNKGNLGYAGDYTLTLDGGEVKHYRGTTLLHTSTNVPSGNYYFQANPEGNSVSSYTFTDTGVDTTPPVITLTGANPQTIELGTGYTELGATTDDGSSVTIDSSAFSDSLGSYSILYNSVDSSGNNAVTITRTVNVVDTTPPVITLTGANPQTIELGTGYTELGATTDDGSAVTIDISNFSDSIGSYSVTYNSVDSSGNNAVTVTRTVNVVIIDITPPILTPPNNITTESTGEFTTVNIGTATATDDTDPNPTITNNASDSFPIGVTIITWIATDDSGNQSTATQTVTIVEPSNVIISERKNNVDPLRDFESFIDDTGGFYFGLGLFPILTMIIGFMAGKKTVRIFTLVILFLMGIFHASGFFVYPDWYWYASLLLGMILVLGRQK